MMRRVGVGGPTEIHPFGPEVRVDGPDSGKLADPGAGGQGAPTHALPRYDGGPHPDNAGRGPPFPAVWYGRGRTGTGQPINWTSYPMRQFDMFSGSSEPSSPGAYRAAQLAASPVNTRL